MEEVIHPSHDMTEWRETIVVLLSTARFGQIRECKKCEGQQAKTVAGERLNEALKTSCQGDL